MAVLAWLWGAVLVVLLVEVILALFVLSRSQGRLAGRFLGAYLLLHAFGLASPIGAFFLSELGWIRLAEDGGWPLSFLYILVSFLPALLLGFALTYPLPGPIVRRNPIWLAVPFLPSLVANAIYLLRGAEWDLVVSFSTDTGTMARYTYPALGLFAYAYLFLGSVAAASIQWLRQRQATTVFSARRHRAASAIVVLPPAIGALFLLLAIGLDLWAGIQDVSISGFPWNVLFWAAFGVAVAMIALVPPFLLAYALLRFQVLDIDLRLRFTIRQSVVATVFLGAYFTLSEGAQAVIQNETGSVIIGILGLIPIFLALHPLQRMADRLAGRAVPGANPAEKYREFRRWEVYRATFEDLSGDGELSERDRRALANLARSLGLDPEARATIENEVRKERAKRAA